MNRIYLSYKKAKKLIEEGDVLLFSGQGWFSKIFMRTASESIYTHVGVASKHNNIIECVEFKENIGGRTSNLENQFNEYKEIDVYRAVPRFSTYNFNELDNKIEISHKSFDGKLVTNCMRKMTGLPYGWKRIWWIAQHKLPFLRLLYDKEKLMDDSLKEIILPVCSTSLAHCFNKHEFDLMPGKSDEYLEPGDFARSSRLSYLFSIIK